MIGARISNAFAAGQERYGNLGFDFSTYHRHLSDICSRCAGSEWKHDTEAFLGSLHSLDLYLALGCSRLSARAWQCFDLEFHDYIARLAIAATACRDEGVELADIVLVGLCMPDRRGRTRIASYDGRSSLATWLRVLVSHRAINERRSARNRPKTLEALPDPADEKAQMRFETDFRAHRYGDAAHEALREACARLTERERLVLLLRYGQVQKVQEIAGRLRVHPSNVTRLIERARERLRALVLLTLREKYRFDRSATDECLIDLVENPRHSILALLEVHSEAREAVQGALRPRRTAAVV